MPGGLKCENLRFDNLQIYDLSHGLLNLSILTRTSSERKEIPKGFNLNNRR